MSKTQAQKNKHKKTVTPEQRETKNKNSFMRRIRKRISKIPLFQDQAE